jgi:ribosome-binding factor A
MTNKERKIEKLASWFSRSGADFIASRFGFKEGLITVSRAEIEPSLTRVKIYFTVYPETKEREILEKLKKAAPDFREYVKNFYRIRRLPIFEFDIDYGEKNRMRIEELLLKEKSKIVKKSKKRKF